MSSKLAFTLFAEIFNIFFATESGFEFRPPFDFVNPN